MVYFKDLNPSSVNGILSNYGLQINCLDFNNDIPHSFWGTPEAGRVTEQLYIRGDTPVHSILHESAHFVCMPEYQRSDKQVDAKGSAMEENATCYLQILLADQLQGYDRKQIMKDMDAWGYNFRLGSAHRWFTKDAEEVKIWLVDHDIIDEQCAITWQLRS